MSFGLQPNILNIELREEKILFAGYAPTTSDWKSDVILFHQNSLKKDIIYIVHINLLYLYILFFKEFI